MKASTESRPSLRLLIMAAAILAGVGLAPGVHAATGCVPNAGIDPGCTTGHATIQAAVDAATAGDTILVAPGTYGTVIVAKQLTILGAKAGLDACDRDGMGESTITAASPTRLMELKGGSAGTVIDGFTFKEGGNALESTSGPIDDVRILNNRFVEFTSSAIFLNDSGDDIDIDQNLIDGTLMGGGGALHLDSDAFDGMHITNNCIRHGVTGIFSDGNRNVGLSAGRSPLLAGNDIDDNTTGVNLGRKSWEDCDIILNRFVNSGFDGLQGGPANCTIEDNFFLDNGRWGLALTGFGGGGDATRGAQLNTVENNCIAGNIVGGVIFSSSQFPGTIATNVVNTNNVVGNTDGAVYSGTETIDSTSNWWGAADGPSGDGAGSGDTVDGMTGGGMITFSPFLTAPVVIGVEICDNGIDDNCDGLVDAQDPTCPLTVFVSSIKSDGNLGGVAGADQQCNVLASLAGLTGGPFKAWLSDGSGGPATTFTPGAAEYMLVDGTVIADDFADLTDGTLDSEIDLDENGVAVGDTQRIWTGTNADGTPRDGGALCSNWTLNSSFDRGAQGRPDRTDSTWSFAGAAACNKERRIYCFQQPAPVETDPPPGTKLIFVTSTLSNGALGGLAGADATCSTLADAAGLGTNFLAWLSDVSDSPSTRFFQNPLGYRRVDGTLVANDYADLTDGSLAAPINVTENNDLLPGTSGSKVWTGTNAFGNALGGGARCSEWTSGSSVPRGGQGRTDSTASTWSFSGASPCNQMRRLYCVEQEDVMPATLEQIREVEQWEVEGQTKSLRERRDPRLTSR